jgi:transcriptional regulator with XRE-family HTH domain
MTARKVPEQMGDRIRGAREAEGLTQAQVGRALDVTRSSVGGWESNEYHPEPEHWEKLAKILKTTVTYLITGSGDRPREATEEDKKFVRLTTLHLKNMILEGRFDEFVHPRIVALLETGLLDDVLREHGYRRDVP